MNRRNKYPRLIKDEKRILLEYMIKHKNLAHGPLTEIFTQTHHDNLWRDLVKKLNAIRGVERPYQHWKKSWMDIKSKIKKKAHKIRAQENLTGSDLSTTSTLDLLEERIVDIIDTKNYGFECPRRGEYIKKKTIRYPPINNIQRGIMLEYMIKHENLAHGQITKSHTKIEHENLWRDLVKKLNSIQGCEKPCQQWKKSWVDIKWNIKKKAPSTLDFLEKQIVHIIRRDAPVKDGIDAPLLGIKNYGFERPGRDEYTKKKTIRYPPMNNVQRGIMLEYMIKHENLAHGRITKTHTKIEHENLWRDLVKKLNAIQGCEKPCQHWKKSWLDIKWNIKKKAPSTRDFLEKQIVDIIHRDASVKDGINAPLLGTKNYGFARRVAYHKKKIIRYPRVNNIQRGIMLEYMIKHENLVHGRITNSPTKIEHNLWRDLVKELNAISGCERSFQHWKKSWLDIKSKIKKKAPSTLDFREKQIMDIIRRDASVKDGIDAPLLGTKNYGSEHPRRVAYNNTKIIRCPPVNKMQRKIMLEYMIKHENLAHGRLTDTFTKIEHDNLWRDLGKKLNAIRGVEKPYHHWKRSWIVIKSNIKKKAPSTLDFREKQIVNIIRRDASVEDGIDPPLLETKNYGFERPGIFKYNKKHIIRCPRMNKTQKRIMLEYLSKHENMALGRLTDTFTKIDHDNMWRDLGKKLDAIRGWDRPYHDWKKTWLDMRCKMKKKSRLTFRFGSLEKQITDIIQTPAPVNDRITPPLLVTVDDIAQSSQTTSDFLKKLENESTQKSRSTTPEHAEDTEQIQSSISSRSTSPNDVKISITEHELEDSLKHISESMPAQNSNWQQIVDIFKSLDGRSKTMEDEIKKSNGLLRRAVNSLEEICDHLRRST